VFVFGVYRELEVWLVSYCVVCRMAHVLLCCL
jgi:hypothetical protein